nr:calcium-binding protein [Microvirga splendida]
MTDGRLAVAWHDTTRGQSDVSSVIVDPRLTAVTVEGTARNDFYVGSEYGVDILRGYEGNDTLLGGAGNDVLNGGTGADSLNGGEGFDIASYYDATAGVEANLADPTKNSGEALNDRYDLIEGLRGSGFADSLTGNASNNSLEGGDGSDTLKGGAGNDTLLGGNNDDLLYGGLGADSFDGGAGTDTVTYEFTEARVGVVVDLQDPSKNSGEAKGDSYTNIEAVIGTIWNDTLSGYDDPNRTDSLFGGSGQDSLTGGRGNDYLNGGEGSDTLNGGLGADTFFGWEGNDFASYEDAQQGVVTSLSASVRSIEAEGDTYESIEGLIGSSFIDTLEGDEAANELRGMGGDDKLFGGGGSDTLEGGAGKDALDGGDGDAVWDYASYERALTGVTADLSNEVMADLAPGLGAAVAGTGDASGDRYRSIEGLIGSAYGDTLYGNEGANILRGMGGNDVLVGRAGADQLDGGAGIDTASYATAGAGVTVNLASGKGAGSDTQGDTYASIENVIGSNFADVFVGNGAVNVFQGGAGDDVYYVGAGDIVIENANSGNDKVVTSANYTLGANIEVLEGTGAGALALTGNALNNTIIGNDAGNWIDGGIGADTMMGGAGDDIYVIDNAGDVVEDYSGNNTIVTSVQLNPNNVRGSFVNITVAEGYSFNVEGTNGDNVLMGNRFANTLKGNGGHDKIYGLQGNDRLYGGSGKDAVYGDAGNDRLYGDSGNDKVYGGLGNDLLRGGSGKDVFVFDTRPNKRSNVDKIYDFKSRDDSFHLENKYFTKLGSGSSKGKKFKSDMFTEGKKAQDREDRIVYDKKTGALYYDQDGTGSKAQVKIATITNKTTLKYHDFFVI